MNEFIYNKADSYKNNYRRWRRMNRKERKEFNMQLLTKEQSRQIFDEIYGRNKPLLARLISFLKS